MFTRRQCLSLFVAIGTLPAQEAPASLRITGAVKDPLTLAADDLAKMPRASVKTMSGMETVYEGVWVHEVLKRTGAPQGSA